MNVKLKDVATISSGVTFRSRIESSLCGNIKIIQMKDLSDDTSVNVNNIVSINSIEKYCNHRVEIGDIIFRSRGQVNTATIIQTHIENAIVSAPLFRVRVDKEKIVPEFLVWWINQRTSQNYLSSQSKGTLVKMISKEALDSLEVSLPSLVLQKKIAEFFKLSCKEQALLNKIKDCRSIYVQKTLLQMASS